MNKSVWRYLLGTLAACCVVGTTKAAVLISSIGHWSLTQTFRRRRRKTWREADMAVPGESLTEAVWLAKLDGCRRKPRRIEDAEVISSTRGMSPEGNVTLGAADHLHLKGFGTSNRH